MAKEDNDTKERRSPSQATIENTVAIGQLIAVSERTTNDVDKIIRHIEKILPVHAEISNLKKLLYGTVLVAIAYGSWMAIEYHRVDKEVAKLEIIVKDQAVKIERNREESMSKSQYNKNQITYLKGRIKK